MEALALIGIGFAGSVFWLLNTEATAIYYGSALGWHPLAVGSVLALGQCIMYVLLYLGGGPLLVRWGWLRRRVERAREHFAAKLERRYLALAGLGGVVGVPPATLMPVLAPGFGVGLMPLLGVAFVARTTRFTALAAVGQVAVPWVMELF